MKNTGPWTAMAALALTFALDLVQAHAQAPRPNIIHILADDLGWGSVGFNGQTQIQTPNLDQLAAGGLRFNRSYAATVCSPTRAMLMTGFHNGHTLNDRNGNINGNAFRDEDILAGEVLAAAGYSTSVFGKHGFGGTGGRAIGPPGSPVASDPVPTVDDPQALPNNHGYQEFFGYLDHGRAHDFFIDHLWETDGGAPNGVSVVPSGVYSPDPIAARAEQFIANHAADAEPFFMQMNYTIPHFDIDSIDDTGPVMNDGVPIAGTAGRGIYAGDPILSDKQERYAAMITRMDTYVGLLVDQLNDPNGDGDDSDSVLEDTLIMFTSDNGPTPEDGSPIDFFEASGGFRGGKRDLYEGGIRVPTFAYWQGTLAAGETDMLTDVADILPTMAELAGTRGPVGMDGVSLAPLLTGEGPIRQRDYLIFEHHERDGPDPDSKDAIWTILRDDVKLIKFAGGQFELFDLSTDPGETSPLDLGSPTNAALKSDLEAIALAEGVELPDSYAVTYRTWTGSDGGLVTDAANWNGSGGPTENWSAVLANPVATPSVATSGGNVTTLGIEVRGDQALQTVEVEQGGTLAGRNEVRISGGGRVQLSDASLASNRWIDVLPDGQLTGHGTVTGDLYNFGAVAPGRPDDLPPLVSPPQGIDTGVVPAITFDFTGIQDDGPVIQTSQQNSHLQLVAGFDFGPGTFPRHSGGGGSDAGDEFNVSGFNTSSLSAAIASNDYLGYAVAPIYGIEMLIDTVEFNLWRNGPNAANDYAIMTSVDGFAVGAELGTLNSITDEGIGNQHLFSAQYTGSEWVTGGVEVRVYGWNANNNGNTHFNAASLTGSFRSVPTIELDPTGVLSLSGDFFHVKDGELAIDLGGSNNSNPLDPEFDQLIVSGEVELAGDLSLAFVDGFEESIAPLQSFDIITAGAISGTFDTINGVLFSTISGERALAVIYDATTVTATMTLPGDANLDGSVSIADFATVQSNFGGDGTWSDGDFNGDGVVSIADFALLQSNFGDSLMLAAPVTAAVPEPSSISLLVAFLLILPILTRTTPHSQNALVIGTIAKLRRRISGNSL